MGRLRRFARAIRARRFWIVILIAVPVVVFVAQNLLGDIVSYVTEFFGITSQSILGWVLANLLWIIISLPFVALFIIVVREYYLVLSEEGWDEVGFSTWSPVGGGYNPVWGGIKLQNNKDFDLEECEAEIIGYDDDREVARGFIATTSLFKDSWFPRKLFWRVDGEFWASTKIGRGKEAYLAIAYPSSKDDVQVVGREFQFRIQTSGMIFVHPIENGFVDVRLSARVNNKPLAPIIKSVRIEVQDKTVFIRDVIDVQEKRKPK